MSEKLYTKVDVLYRDAGNWKQSESYIVENKLTLEQLAPYLDPIPGSWEVMWESRI